MNERPADYRDTTCTVDGHPCEGQGTDADCRACLVTARREAELRGAQLLMVASELAGDPKIHWLRDRSDPRWTPTLQEAFAARQKHREDAEQIAKLLSELLSLKQRVGDLKFALGTDAVVWFDRCNAAERQRDHFKDVLSDFAEWDCDYGDGCPTFRSRHGKCVGCKARDALQESKP